MSHSRQDPQVREFLLQNVTQYPNGLAPLAAKQFGLSRTAISKYLKRLVAEGLIEGEGQTRARKYALKSLVNIGKKIEIVPGLAEDVVWRDEIVPHILPVPDHIRTICQHGFTEMFNNVIDHSGGKYAHIVYNQDYEKISMAVMDDGIGIFEKIRRDFDLADTQTALLELSKGKLTSDASRHSGEGIFFTSRMFDPFMINSGTLTYRKLRADEGWLVETERINLPQLGTLVHMVIPTNATWTVQDIFSKHQDDEYRFSKTNVPIKLGRYSGEGLISRSQARRILARFEKFSEVILDFEGIDEIGQSFADEIFRVYRIDHPNVHIKSMNANERIKQMISHVIEKPTLVN